MIDFGSSDLIPAATKLVIVGAGGFAREVTWALERMQANAGGETVQLVGYSSDDVTIAGRAIGNLSVLGTPAQVAARFSEPLAFYCAIGTNRTRKAVVERLAQFGWQPFTVIDPGAVIAPSATIGPGSYVGPGAIISVDARIGMHVILNHDCQLGHDVLVEDFGQVSPGARVSGAARLKEGSLMGANAVIFQGKTLGAYSVLGAASFAVRDVPDGVTAMGNPARNIAGPAA